MTYSSCSIRTISVFLGSVALIAAGSTPKEARAQGGVSGTSMTFKGKNFFPIGLYDYPRGGQVVQNDDVNHFSQIAADGFNTVHLYDHDCGWPLGVLETCTAANLQSANNYGLAVVDSLYTYNYSGATCWLYQSSQTQVGSAMYTKLQALKSYPALLAWEHMDETGVTWANYGTATPYYFPANSQFQTDYTFIKTYGGGIPVWYNDGPAYFQNAYYSIAAGQTWANYCDAYSNDIYPGSNGGSSDEIKKQMDWTVHCEANKPQFAVLNAGDHANDQWSYAERAYMVYTAIIHGARGVFWWGAFNLNDTDPQWQWIVWIASQLKAMQIPLANNTVAGYTYRDVYSNSMKTSGISVSNTNLEARCFVNGNMRYLIVANTSSSAISAAINSVSGWHGATLYTGLVGGSMSFLGTPVSYSPHQVVVYTDYPINGTYKFVNYASGKALDDTGSGGAGTTLDQWTYTAGTNQRWTLTSTGNGMDGTYFTIQCAANNLYATVNGSTSTGAAVKLAAYTGANDQQWSLVAGTGANSPWLVKNRLSGYVMDVTGASTANGALIDQWTQTGNGNQLWWIWSP